VVIPISALWYKQIQTESRKFVILFQIIKQIVSKKLGWGRGFL